MLNIITFKYQKVPCEYVSIYRFELGLHQAWSRVARGWKTVKLTCVARISHVFVFKDIQTLNSSKKKIKAQALYIFTKTIFQVDRVLLFSEILIYCSQSKKKNFLITTLKSSKGCI